MRQTTLVGIVLLTLGLALLVILRRSVVRLFLFVLEFLGVFLGFLLLASGFFLILIGRRVFL